MIQVLEQRFPGDQGPTSCPRSHLDWCPHVPGSGGPISLNHSVPSVPMSLGPGVPLSLCSCPVSPNPWSG